MIQPSGHTTSELLTRSPGRRVYRGQRNSDARPVIIKVYETNPEFAAHEFATLGRFDPSSTVRALAVVPHEDATALVLEDFGGQPLTRIIDEAELRVEQALLFAIRITLALVGVHRQGYVHRALTTSSVSVNLATKEVKLDDFHACVLASDIVAAGVTTRMVGELTHVAPEQTGRIDARSDHRADLYSLGVIFFNLFTGRLPFECATPSEYVHSHLAVAPPKPESLVPGLAPALCRVIEKLLAKSADDRYQSGIGVVADLERCLAQLLAGVDAGEFELGRHDASQVLHIPSRLYGRADEVDGLWRTYLDACEGARSLVLVSGPAGIGKTALVSQFRRGVVNRGGTLIEGKFDAHAHDVPFAALSSAFEQLMARLLSEGDEELETRRELLLEVLGANGQLMIDLIPSLEHIIGPQPQAPEVEPADRFNRFNHFFATFVASFCQGSSPLVLFLDDLQWADAVSLDVLQQLLERTAGNLLVVGSCRTQEAPLDTDDRLAAMNAQLREVGIPVTRIELGPLSEEQIAQLLVDTLGHALDEVRELAVVARLKTGGVPRFIEQFLATLSETEALFLDQNTRKWRWDLDEVDEAGATSNVDELTLERLPRPIRETLARAACIGGEFSLAQVESISSEDAGELLSQLAIACQVQLLVRVTSGDEAMCFAFAHDRLHQAAYDLLAPQARARLHLDIARAPGAERELSLFELVGHLNLGWEQLALEGRGSRVRAVELNRDAAARASAQAAFAAAVSYLEHAAELLPSDCWEQDHELAFGVHLALLEGYVATTATDKLGAAMSGVLSRARTVEERVGVLAVKSWYVHGRGAFEDALELELEVISQLGIDLPSDPEAIEARCQAGRERVDAIDSSVWLTLPLNTESELLAKALSNSSSSALNLGKKKRYEMLVLETLTHSLDRGRSSKTALALAYYATLQLPRDHAGRSRAIELGAAASSLAQGHPVAQVHVEFTNCVFVYPWDRSFAEGLVAIRRVQQMADDLGDQVWSSFALWLIALLDCLYGGPLTGLIKRCNELHRIARDAQSVFIAGLLELTIGFAEALEADDPSAGLRRLEAFKDGPFAQDMIHVSYAGLVKRVVLYMQGDYAQAWELSRAHAPAFEHAFAGSFHEIHTVFFHALVAAARAAELRGSPRVDVLEQLDVAVETLSSWAQWVPENYSTMHLLARAEQRGLEGEGLVALDDYDAAIAAAQDDAIYLSALCNERAARYLQARGKAPLSWAYLVAARRDYERWNAHGKAAALAAELRQLQLDRASFDDEALSYTSTQSLDISAVMQSVRAISGELDMAPLLATTLDIIVKNAGAERGLLLLEREGQLSIAASCGSARELSTSGGSSGGDEYARQVVQWVRRTGQTKVLANAAASEQFSGDPYIRRHSPQSLLCMPLRGKHDQSLGLLYLENNLQSAVFSSGQLEVLELLLAQSSISIENARLFRQKAQIEGDLRTAYEIIGESPIIVLSWAYAAPASMLFVSNNVERLLGYAPEDFVTWTTYAQLLHPKDRGRVHAALDAAAADPSVAQLRQEPYRVVTATGDTRWIDALTLFDRDEQGRVSVCRGLVEDITEKHELASQLLHAQKMDALGLLAGGVAHDFNNLLTVMMGNTDFLLESLPQDSEHREEVENIASATTRAAGVTRQLLSFSRKERVEPRVIRVGEAVADMLNMLDRVIGENIQLELLIPDELAAIRIDPSQLEQIILNLVVNARDAMPKGGELRIEIAKVPAARAREQGFADARVSVSVSDTGCGMSPAVSTKIFEPFFTTKAAGEGTGLGLATVHSIVTQAGGSIRVDSQEGIGTRFDLTFTSVEHEVEHEVEAAPALELGRGRGELVLVIEDEAPVRAVVARFLERHGYRALTCGTAREALALIDECGDTIDVVLSDVVLREGSGRSAAEAVSARCPRAAVVFMSGYTDDTLAEYGVLGADTHFLNKPFGPEQLVRKIGEVLAQAGRIDL